MQQISRAKLATFFQKLLKIVHTSSVNETKVTLRNAFIDNLFALEVMKNQKMTKEPSFETTHLFVT